MAAVHPHARGERLCIVFQILTDRGSSPRTWGTLQRKVQELQAQRFIPTHVGNANGSGNCRCSVPVHPHARGERFGVPCIGHTGDGSSPRTWGTPATRPRLLMSSRFIPTHVGNAASVMLNGAA